MWSPICVGRRPLRRRLARGVWIGVNKSDLIAAVEDRLGSKAAAQNAVEAILETIVTEVAKGGKVSLTGFGTFEKAARAARTGRNPRTGETVRIRKTSVPRFIASAKFKEYVKSPKSLPKTTPLARASSTAAAKAAAAPARTTTTAVKSAPASATAAKTTTKTSSAKAATAKKSAAEATAPVAKKATKAAGKGAKKSAKKS